MMTKHRINIEDYSLDVFQLEDWGKGDGESVIEEVMDFFRLPDNTFVMDDKKVIEIFKIEDFKNYINNNHFRGDMLFYSPDGLDDDDDFQLVIFKGSSNTINLHGC